MKTQREPPQWKPREFPEERETFKIINEWAKAVVAWQERVWAMCAIAEVSIPVSPMAFEKVLKLVRAGQHDPATIKRVLDEDKASAAGRAPAIMTTDVVGHPPDPPFDGV